MARVFYRKLFLYLALGLGTGQEFASGQGIKVGQGIRRPELKAREVILVQSLDPRLSRQIRQGFQERLAKEEGWSCSFLTYEVKGKVDNIPVIAQLLSRKEADLVLTMGVSAAHTALLASKLKAEMRAKGESEMVASQVSPEKEEVKTQVSAAHTALLASKLKAEMSAQGKKEAVKPGLTSSEREEVKTQVSGTHTAILASKLKAERRAQGEREVVASQVSPEREEIKTQVSAAHTALLASKLKAERRAQGEKEAVEPQLTGSESGEVESPCGQKSEKAESQPVLGDAPTPIVFTAVTDPFYTHILPKNKPLEYVYGVLDPPPLQDQLRLIRLIMPGLERLGVVYSEDVVNMVKVVEDLKEMADVFGITVVTRPVTSLEAVAKAYLELAPEVEAFFLPLDNRLLVQLDLVLALAHQAGLPVFALDTASVEKGALACLGYNYYEAGKMAAEVAIEVFKQGIQAEASAPAEPPKLVPQKQRLTLNQKTARRLRIIFPASVLRQADSILD